MRVSEKETRKGRKKGAAMQNALHFLSTRWQRRIRKEFDFFFCTYYIRIVWRRVQDAFPDEEEKKRRGNTSMAGSGQKLNTEKVFSDGGWPMVSTRKPILFRAALSRILRPSKMKAGFNMLSNMRW